MKQQGENFQNTDEKIDLPPDMMADLAAKAREVGQTISDLIASVVPEVLAR